MRATQKVDGGPSKPWCGLWWVFAISVLLTNILFVSLPAQGQDVSPQNTTAGQTTTTGTVSSWTRSTLVVRTEDGQYRLFIFDRNTTRPGALPLGSEVRVVSTPTSEPGVRLAVVVTIEKAPPSPSAGTPPAQQQPDVIPASVRNVERSIEREAKRFKLGFQGGLALDPELVVIGVHSKLGPFFNRNLFFRPSAEFAYGEVTRLFGINAEAIYILPTTARSRWYPYFGGGPAFNFVERSFSSNHGVDFSDFNFDSALNILLGIQYRNGVFTEIKSSIYASPAPVFRLLVGYTF